MQARVYDNSDPSKPFPVLNGIKQWCLLAPKLFRVMISAMLADDLRDEDIEIDRRYRINGKLFSLKSLKSKLIVKYHIIKDLFVINEATVRCQWVFLSS